MEFKTRKISRGPVSSEKKPHLIARATAKKINPRLKMQLFALAGAIGVVVLLIVVIFLIIRSLDFSGIIFSFGKTLETAPSGKTNILLVGVGGEGHDGPNLTDTIIVAGIDYKTKMVPMLAIPRDLFVETKQTGRSRINEVLHLAINKYGQREAMGVLKDVVSLITGMPIQYYVRIDFDGFKKIVDDLGGVDVNVEEDIYDPEFPKGETIYYETFSIKKGLQHLDGETALKYARSRHGNSGGNFGRAKRQQQLLFAIKEKALSLNILTDPGKISQLYNSVSESIDTNLSLAEIIELAKLSKDMNKDSTIPLVISDIPDECGGLVYTPAREFFDGASVLLPAGGNYDHMQLFVNTVYNDVKTIQDSADNKIQVLNGTKTAGLAYEGMSILSRFCLNVVYYGNAENRDLEESTVYYKTGPNGEKPAALDIISKIMPELKTAEGIPVSYLESAKRADSSIVVELGRDYLTKRLKDPFDSLKYLEAPQPKSTQESADSAAINSGTVKAVSPSKATT